MTDLPEDIKLAFAELTREMEPDPALEERVVQAVYAPHRRWWYLAVSVAAAAVLLTVTHPWSPPPAAGQEYVLLLSEGPTYVQTTPAGLLERRREYGRWADSLARLGKLEVEGHLEPQEGIVDGLFIIRATNESDAERIAASCPHNKYGGTVVVRRFVE